VFGKIISVEISVTSHDTKFLVCSGVSVVVEGTDWNAFADSLVTVSWFAVYCVVTVD
jgi:hypothetical protein